MTGSLNFVVLDVHSSGGDRKLDRSLLPPRRYRVKPSAYFCNKYLARYKFPNISTVSCHAPVTPHPAVWEMNGLINVTDARRY